MKLLLECIVPSTFSRDDIVETLGPVIKRFRAKVARPGDSTVALECTLDSLLESDTIRLQIEGLLPQLKDVEPDGQFVINSRIECDQRRVGTLKQEKAVA